MSCAHTQSKPKLQPYLVDRQTDRCCQKRCQESALGLAVSCRVVAVNKVIPVMAGAEQTRATFPPAVLQALSKMGSKGPLYYYH